MTQKGHPQQDLRISFYHKVTQEKSGCWRWISKINKHTGYGQIGYLSKHYLAHRISYFIHKGYIGDDMVIDHLCRNRWCVNPDHLEAVTLKENILRGVSLAAQNARKTKCLRGHDLKHPNLYIRKDRTGRYCKMCIDIRLKKWKVRHR